MYVCRTSFDVYHVYYVLKSDLNILITLLRERHSTLERNCKILTGGQRLSKTHALRVRHRTRREEV